jgi:two-component system response regulator MprA
MSARILVVDDDPAVRNSLRRGLALEGFDVRLAADGEEALRLAAEQRPDLIVLDVMLPGIDGLTVCARLREESSVPVLMLTARDTVPDRVAGLERGADDYLIKPFAFDELLARIHALLRRTQPAPDDVARFADVVVDGRGRVATRGGVPLPLTPREYDLLAAFVQHPQQALSREQLSQMVWGYGFEGESNFVDVAVMDLRRKLEAGGRPRILQTVRGYGYALREA